MFHKKNPNLEKFIKQLGSHMDLCYVFESQLRTSQTVKPIIIILHKGNHSTSMEDKIMEMKSNFEPDHQYTIVIYPMSYAISLFKEYNLFFIQHCQKENLIYQLKDSSMEELEVEDLEFTFENISEQFDNQLLSCFYYYDAALENRDDGNLVKALINLQAYHKSLFDIAALFHLGYKFKTGSILELQNLMAPYDKKLGNIYNKHSNEELQLLKLLDQVSGEATLLNSTLNENQIELLIAKASRTREATVELFSSQIKAAKLSFEKFDKLRTLTQTEKNQDYQKIRQHVQQLVNRKIMELRPGHNKTYYKSNIKIDGPADILYHISAMLKVCITALGRENTSNLPNSNMNIQTTLEHILQLLPFEEVECLERIIKELEITTEHYVLEPPRQLYA